MTATDLSTHRDSRPNRAPSLTVLAGEVDIWHATLDRSPIELDRMIRSLSANERERAARFHFDRDRNHFVAGRSILRDILSRYLACGPGEVRLMAGAHGKPELAAPAGRLLRFNLSHATGIALYAIAHGREVGIDLECIRADLQYDDIAEKFFAPGEIRRLRELPPDQRIRGFFNCWTRKEAYVKARGQGLSTPLDGFEVSLAPGEPAALLSEDASAPFLPGAEPSDLPQWSLADLHADPGFVAALAVEGTPPILETQEWAPSRDMMTY